MNKKSDAGISPRRRHNPICGPSLSRVYCRQWLRICGIGTLPTDVTRKHGLTPNFESKFSGHEHAIWVRAVVCERRAIREAELAVDSVSGLEVIHRSRFQAQSAIIPSLRFRNDVAQEQAGDALSEVCFAGAHGLDFAMLEAELFQGPATDQLAPLKSAPEGNFRFAQFIKIERMPALGRRHFGQRPKVLGKKLGNSGTREVVDSDLDRRLNHRGYGFLIQWKSRVK